MNKENLLWSILLSINLFFIFSFIFYFIPALEFNTINILAISFSFTIIFTLIYVSLDLITEDKKNEKVIA